MTRYLKYGLAGMSLAVTLVSPAAFSQDAITVSSLAGLQTAINNAPASGRTITLAQGVYQESSPIRIQGKTNLTIQGATSNYDDTVIQGPGINDSSLYVNFKVNNSDQLTIRNLTVRDSYYHGIQLNNDSDGFTADHVKAIDNGESGFKVSSPSNASGPAAYSDNGLIENSYIGFSDTGQRSVVEGVDLVGVNGWTLRGNTFNNIRKPNGSPAYAAFAKGNSSNVTFENNTVQNSFIGLSFGGGGTGSQYFRNGDTSVETRGGVIRNNRISDTTDVGIYMNQASGFEIVNNTVTNNGENTGSIAIRFSASNGEVHDNVTSGKIRLRNGASANTYANQRIGAD